MWTFVTPQLAVPDVVEAQRWYRDMLDFEVGHVYGERFASAFCGRTEIFFSRHEGPPAPTTCCVRVADVGGLFAVYRERGVKIVEDLGTKPWGMREFTIRDPWGNAFRIGQSTRC